MHPLCVVSINSDSAEISRSPLFALLQLLTEFDLAKEIDLWFLAPADFVPSLTAALSRDLYKPAILPYDTTRGLSPLVKALPVQFVLNLDGSTVVWTQTQLPQAIQILVKGDAAAGSWSLYTQAMDADTQASIADAEQLRAWLQQTLDNRVQQPDALTSSLREYKALLAAELSFWVADDKVGAALRVPRETLSEVSPEVPVQISVPLSPPAPRSLYGSQFRRIGRMLLNLTTPKLGMLNQYVPRTIRIPALPDVSSSNLPSIAIVTPSYNQASFVAKTMESVLSHNYPKLQYVVQDGGSSDDTPVLLEQYAPRLTYAESARDGGQADAINRGFARTTGEIMAYLNSDDLLLPGTLQYVGAYFAAHPEVDVIYGHRIIINENDLDVGRWLLPAHDSEVLSWADYVPQETLFWRRSAWEKAGGAMDESFRFALDWDLILRFRESGATFRRLPRFLGAFRIHTQQKTSKDMFTIGQQEMFRLRERALGRQVTQAEINERIKPYLERHLWEHVRYRLATRLLASQYITYTPEPKSTSS